MRTVQYKLQMQSALAWWGGAVLYTQLSAWTSCDHLMWPVPPSREGPEAAT